MTNNKDFLYADGKIIKLLGNKDFLVELHEDKRVVSATVTSRFRANAGPGRKKIIEGDLVEIEISLDDWNKGRIVSFAKTNKK